MVFADLEETNNNLLENKLKLENTVEELKAENKLSEKNKGIILSSIPVWLHQVKNTHFYSCSSGHARLSITNSVLQNAKK